MQLLKKFWPVLILILFASLLRFPNLSYSEYQDDEQKAFIRNKEGETVYEFLLKQRKGPMQFFVTSATLLFNNDPLNELIIRMPFTIANTLAVVAFFFLLYELFDNKLIAFLGALLFSLNGFIVGFSRIAQYQNLNILFSLTSLFCFIKLSKAKDKFLPLSLLGTLFLSLSVLSHWDAIYFLVPIAYFYIGFIFNKEISNKTKVLVTLANLLLGCSLLLPFLIPYIKTQKGIQENMLYFNRRMGVSDYSWENHKFIYELYNPYLSIYFLAFLAFLGIFNKKKRLLLILWFVVNLLAIRFLMKKPGTHIYNYVIPLTFLATSGIHFLHKNKKLFKTALIPIVLGLGFLYYQSFMLFVDNKQEYPWEEKKLINLKKISLTAKKYSETGVLTFGFPHFRDWKKVNEIVLNDPDNCSYISNEGKEIAQIYMDSKNGIYENRSCYYIVDVKRTFIIRENYTGFAQTKKKKPVYVYSHEGEKLMKLYKIDTE